MHGHTTRAWCTGLTLILVVLCTPRPTAAQSGLPLCPFGEAPTPGCVPDPDVVALEVARAELAAGHADFARTIAAELRDVNRRRWPPPALRVEAARVRDAAEAASSAGAPSLETLTEIVVQAEADLRNSDHRWAGRRVDYALGHLPPGRFTPRPHRNPRDDRERLRERAWRVRWAVQQLAPSVPIVDERGRPR